MPTTARISVLESCSNRGASHVPACMVKMRFLMLASAKRGRLVIQDGGGKRECKSLNLDSHVRPSCFVGKLLRRVWERDRFV